MRQLCSTSATTLPNTHTHTHTHPHDLHTCCPVTNELHNVACFILFPNTHSNYILHKFALLSAGVGHTPTQTHAHAHAHIVHTNQTNFVIHINSTNALIRGRGKASQLSWTQQEPFVGLCVCVHIDKYLGNAWYGEGILGQCGQIVTILWPCSESNGELRVVSTNWMWIWKNMNMSTSTI